MTSRGGDGQEESLGESIYFAHITQSGPLKYRDVPGSIGVHDSLDNHMPIGEAHCRTWDGSGLAEWELSVAGQRVQGWWVIVDREFKPAQ